MRRMYSEPQLLKAVENESAESGIKVYENIVDKDGHKRFIGGSLTIEAFNSREVKYAHWSLSGSHLLIVICFSVANSETIGTSQVICNLNGQIPQWIIDKIYPIFSDIVEYKTLDFRADNYTSQTASGYLQKTTAGTLRIFTGGNLTLSADRTVRIAYDLLIDNE